MKSRYFIPIFLLAICLILVPASAITWVAGTGCWTATDGTYNYVMWNNTGTDYNFTVPEGITNITYLNIAGGGGGGYSRGAGGGAGGAKTGNITVTPGQGCLVRVGAGGAGGSSGRPFRGEYGSNTTFCSIKSDGGGGGGSAADNPGLPGGSGGGSTDAASAGATTGGSQGNNGGVGSGSAPSYGAGAGGGATAIGGAGSGTNGGVGAAGITSSITGSSVCYAGGGGGGTLSGGVAGTATCGGGTGGAGGPGTSGTNDTGGGGGGGGYAGSGQTGGNGAGGVVIIRYLAPVSYISSFTSTNISVVVNSTSQGWAGVSPFTMQFNDTSTNTPTYGNYTYQGYGSNTTFGYNFSTSLNTTATFTVGNFSISHGAGNANGFNLSTQTTWINVSANIPVATFTPSGVITGNNTVIQNFNDTSTGSPTTWNWSYQGIFAGNNTQTIWATSQNATGVFNAGNFSIKLNVTNAYGYNLSTQTTWVNVTATSLVSDFIPNQTIAYQYPAAVKFTDNSTDAITWNYTFGDTYTSTSTSPTHIYTVANNYTIQQNVTNITGGYATSTKYFNLTTDDDIWLKSWLQFNNATVIDLQGVAWTNSGTSISTNSKFGSGALYVPTGNNYLYSPSSSVWDRSSVAGELEFWINITALGDAGKPLIKRSTGSSGISDGWGFYNTNGTINGYSFWYGNSATNHTTPFTIPMNTWTHVALVRNTSQYWNVYVNGVWQSSAYVDELALDTTNPMQIGAYGTGNEFGFYMDEWRFTQGVPRFVSDFSTPFAQYNGNLYQNYININPNATLLYKSWPSTTAAVVYNLTPQHQTPQIMNITNATSVTFSMTFDPRYEQSMGAVANTSSYPDFVISSDIIDNTKGLETLTITRNAGFSALFDNRTNLCDVVINYYNYTTDQNFTQYFGSANITDGQHNVTYPIENFYDTPVTYGTWTIYPDFTASAYTVAVGASVQFNDTSLGEPTGWTNYGWSFGDGGTSTIQNPVYAYGAIGNYTVTYTSSLIANASVTNSTTKYINVTAAPPPAPIAAFVGTPLIVTAGSSVQFTDQSLNSPTSWLWAFGDGSGNTAQNPLHIYSTIGNYTVNLTATNAQGLSTISKTNYIQVVALAAPVANFTSNVSSGQYPLAVQFNDTSSNVPTSWSWSFGDGGIASTQNPSHTFTGAGNYTVNLTAYNAAGNTTATHYINAVSLSGFNEVDLTMSPQYTLTINFVDYSTNLAIPVVKVVNAVDGTSVNTTTGTYVGTFGYTTALLYCYADGYQARSVSYVMSSDKTETVQLTASTPTVATTATWYSPKTIAFSIVDVYGNRISGATMNAQYNSTTLPTGVSDLINNYGMNAIAANTALNGTLIMNGTTDSMGAVVFTMMSTIKYDITVSYGGNTNTYSFYPQETTYQLKFIVPVATDNIWNDLYANGNTKVWATEPDIGNVTFWWSFQDMTALTTRIDFYLKDADLNTTVYMTNITSPVAGSIYQLNYTVLNERGKNYIAWENYTRSV